MKKYMSDLFSLFLFVSSPAFEFLSSGPAHCDMLFNARVADDEETKKESRRIGRREGVKGTGDSSRKE
uniref:Putative secreted protein n=1 Tax=Ixodes scapularis TaxID=6945 RepID=A0A4D5REB5_IXOSC